MTRRACPGPWHDGLAGLIQRGVPIRIIATRYGIEPSDVLGILAWVRRPDIVKPPAEVQRWLDSAPPGTTENSV